MLFFLGSWLKKKEEVIVLLVKLNPVGDSRIQNATYAGPLQQGRCWETRAAWETDRWLTGQIGRLTDKQPGGQETCKNRQKLRDRQHPVTDVANRSKWLQAKQHDSLQENHSFSKAISRLDSLSKWRIWTDRSAAPAKTPIQTIAKPFPLERRNA